MRALRAPLALRSPALVPLSAAAARQRAVCARRHAVMSASTPTAAAEYLGVFRSNVPQLDGQSYKGQHGSALIIGGSALYTGAPYFAAMGSLRGGGDLATVVCAAEAASTIKAYSPDLMVYAGLTYVSRALSRAKSVVIGPGLGRSRDACGAFECLLQNVLQDGGTLVVDADALWMLSQNVPLIERIAEAPRTESGGRNAVLFLTPNKVELQRLLSATNTHTPQQLAQQLRPNVLLVVKGAHDQIFARDMPSVSVREKASLKRAGGQGDILSGLLATYAFWMLRQVPSDATESHITRRCVAAAVGACTVMRRASAKAFEQRRYAMTASDVLAEVGDALLSALHA